MKILQSKISSLVYKGDLRDKTLAFNIVTTIPFLSWGNVIRTQYLIPKEKDKEYIISAFIGAIINLTMNLIFIPKYGSIGACIGTICAETFVTIYQTISTKKELQIAEYIKAIFLVLTN